MSDMPPDEKSLLERIRGSWPDHPFTQGLLKGLITCFITGATFMTHQWIAPTESQRDDMPHESIEPMESQMDNMPHESIASMESQMDTSHRRLAGGDSTSGESLAPPSPRRRKPRKKTVKVTFPIQSAGLYTEDQQDAIRELFMNKDPSMSDLNNQRKQVEQWKAESNELFEKIKTARDTLAPGYCLVVHAKNDQSSQWIIHIDMKTDSASNKGFEITSQGPFYLKQGIYGDANDVQLSWDETFFKKVERLQQKGRGARDYLKRGNTARGVKNKTYTFWEYAYFSPPPKEAPPMSSSRSTVSSSHRSDASSLENSEENNVVST